MKHKYLCIFLVFIFYHLSSYANVTETYKNVVRFKDCSMEAGNFYNIDPLVLLAIAHQESSGNPSAINHHEMSLGLMQIHPQHHDLLNTYGIEKEHLMLPCQSLAVGAWVLSHCIKIFGNTWDAVGCYNAGTRRNNLQAQRRRAYAEKIFAHYNGIRNLLTHDGLRHNARLLSGANKL